MLRPTFERLPPERKEAFLQACLQEFADHGYEAASTNRIVESLGISKGLLFKYAGSKLALYLHLWEEVLDELGAIQGSPDTYRSPDLFVRIEELFEALLAYHAVRPLRFRFSLRASIDTGASAFPAVEAIRVRVSSQTVAAVFAGVDWDLYAMPRREVEQLFAWQLRGSRGAAIMSLQRDFSMERYETEIRTNLAVLRKLLRGGVYRHEEEGP